MLSVHDVDFRRSLRTRADSLRSDSPRRWGRMTVDQMAWHVNSALTLAVGTLSAARAKPPLPPALLRPIALYLPWPKGKAPALPELIANDTYDLEAERQRFHVLIEELAAKSLASTWLAHPSLGPMSGSQWSRLMAKHTDYHFRQFGV